jgi:hypothetical protein
MLVARSERFDVIIDFAGRAGESFVLANSAPAPNERPAVKDTVIAYPGKVTRIIGKFILPLGGWIRPGGEVPIRLPLPHPGARG